MKLNFLLVALMALVTACGGGGGGGGGNGGGGAATVNGVLVDSAIIGMWYEGPTYSGTTDGNGGYRCKEGETVEFYLPGSTDANYIYFGEIACRKLVSPIELVTNGQKTVDTDLATLTSTERTLVVRVLQLLQSLDSDGDPSNGITFSSSEIDALASEIRLKNMDLDEAMGEIITDSDFDTSLSDIMTAVGRPLDVVSAVNAQAHFASTQSKCSASGCTTTTPQNPPVQSATIKYCMDGYVQAPIFGTYANEIHGYSVIDTVTGLINQGETGIYALVKTSAKIHVLDNNKAILYRVKGGDLQDGTRTWMRFDTGTVTQSEQNVDLIIPNIAYANAFGSTTTIKFSSWGKTPEENAAQSSTLLMHEKSYGYIATGNEENPMVAPDSSDLEWTVSTSCEAPTNVELPQL